jgi:hypothetical protein
MHPQQLLCVRDSIVWRAIRDHLIVFDLDAGRYFELEGSAAAILSGLHENPTIAALVDALAAAHGLATTSLKEDVESFLARAMADGLVEEADGARRRPDEGGEAVALQIGRSSLARGEGLDALRDAFARQHYVRLPCLLEQPLLERLARSIDEGTFVDRTHEGIGTELCLVPGTTTAALQLLFNDPALLAAVNEISGCGVRCFDGRVYRMAASAGHYDSWHSDAGEDRRVAVSLNFGRAAFEGGVLEIREAAASAAACDVPNPRFGDAVMFRISPALRHRVSGVRGAVPRTAWAGWFRTAPDFQDLFFGSLPKA